MTRYWLNTTKYVLKCPNKHQQVPKFYKITLPTLGLSTFSKLIIFTLRNFTVHMRLGWCLGLGLLLKPLKEIDNLD